MARWMPEAGWDMASALTWGYWVFGCVVVLLLVLRPTPRFLKRGPTGGVLFDYCIYAGGSMMGEMRVGMLCDVWPGNDSVRIAVQGHLGNFLMPSLDIPISAVVAVETFPWGVMPFWTGTDVGRSFPNDAAKGLRPSLQGVRNWVVLTWRADSDAESKKELVMFFSPIWAWMRGYGANHAAKQAARFCRLVEEKMAACCSGPARTSAPE